MLVIVENGLAGCDLAVRRGAVTVVVDALRASATIASLLHYGVEELLVVREVEEALAQRQCWPDALLVGERRGLMIPGFDLGNSPLQASPKRLERRVIFTSSNCSRCCVGCAPAPAAFLGATVNAKAVAETVVETCQRLGTDQVVIVTAGSIVNEAIFTLEDHVAAGALMAALERTGVQVTAGNDRAAVCRLLYGKGDPAELRRAFQECENGTWLTKMGLGADVEFASQLDVFGVAPRIVEQVPLPGGGTGALVRRDR